MSVTLYVTVKAIIYLLFYVQGVGYKYVPKWMMTDGTYALPNYKLIKITAFDLMHVSSDKH